MQQRRLRLGDILDDYCPRERRITNHAVVAMIDDDVKQTRCTTCDADHEYKQAKTPARRKKESAAPLAPADVRPDDEMTFDGSPVADEAEIVTAAAEAAAESAGRAARAARIRRPTNRMRRSKTTARFTVG